MSEAEDSAEPYEHVPGVTTALDLDGDGSRIAQARHLTAGFLVKARAEHGLSISQRGVELAQLAVSELVTNVHKYAPGPALMSLRIVGDAVEIVVRDSEPSLPVPRGADAARAGQHGLEIVKIIARFFEMRQEPAGKSVTVRIALTDDADDTLTGSCP
ncbi:MULTISPECIES: ATP-binding protein [unclassified Streptomyces]|uniref:ATP-binding protein n=1 Tax=unclassified Streptomyces TaxID=2593676 RepID=UPI00380174BC